MVTHNETISAMAHKTVYLKDGTVSRIAVTENRTHAYELEW